MDLEERVEGYLMDIGFSWKNVQEKHSVSAMYWLALFQLDTIYSHLEEETTIKKNVPPDEPVIHFLDW